MTCSTRPSSAFLLAGGEGLGGLLVYGRGGLFHEFTEALGGEHAVVTRVRDIDVENLLRLARPRRHDHHAVAEEDRFLKIVCNEKDRYTILVEDLQQRLVHH